MRGVIRTVIPKFRRLLLIESGSRDLLEGLIPGIYKNHGVDTVVDVVTCYAGQPKGLASTAIIYRLSDYAGSDGRRRLVATLQRSDYNVCGMICSGEVIMSRWKWYLALHVPAKTFVLNENGDYFWLDRAHIGLIWHFVLFRMGLAGAAAVPTLLRLLAFPFTLCFLVAFAGFVNLRRRLRMVLAGPSPNTVQLSFVSEVRCPPGGRMSGPRGALSPASPALGRPEASRGPEDRPTGAK